jgi:ATP-dependent exoDNAse (exonuclease V) alpha subunit
VAIYHLSTAPMSRTEGRSAVAAAAYRSGTELADARTGQVFDYTRKGGVLSAEIVTPAGVPVPEREALWNAAEAAERRKDSRIAREWRVALPAELDDDQRKELARELGQAIAARFGVAVDVCVHAPDKEGDDRNFHAHLLATTRQIDVDGNLGAKASIELGNKDRAKAGIPGTTQDEITAVRAQWAELTNAALERAGHAVRVDHRSYAAQGIDLTPTKHIGVSGVAMDRKGKDAERVELHDETRAENAAKIAANPGIILEKITTTQAVFDRRDMARELARHIDDAAQFQAIMAKLETSPELVQMAPEQRDGSRFIPAKYSTREMVDVERRMIGSAQELAGSHTHDVSRATMERVTANHGTLSDEQRQAVQGVTNAGRLHVIIGDAGTGKSFAMRVAKEAWEAEGYKVIGGALAGKAADELEAGSGIKSNTLASLEIAWQKQQQMEAIEKQRKASHAAAMDRYHKSVVRHQYAQDKWQRAGRNSTKPGVRGRGAPKPPKMPAPYKPLQLDRSTALDSKTVLVIDEAGMVGSRQLGRLLEAAEKAGAKVVMLGDDKQLAAIEAGAGFRAITERIGASEITQIRRQSEQWAKDASAEFARGDVRKALDAYNERGQVRIADTREDAKAALAADWLAGREAGKTSIILAHTNADVRDLNELIHDTRKQAGELGAATEFQTERGKREFAEGGRVVFLKNDRALGVKNGTLGTVERAEDGRLSVKLDNGKAVEFDAGQYGHVDHGYAVTIHKSQGVTVDRAYVLATGGMDRNLAYVGMTRHREAATLYAGGDDFRSYDHLARGLARQSPKETTLDFPGALHGFAERRDFDGAGVVRQWIDKARETVAGLADRAEKAMGRVLEAAGIRRDVPALETATPEQIAGLQQPQARPEPARGFGFVRNDASMADLIGDAKPAAQPRPDELTPEAAALARIRAQRAQERGESVRPAQVAAEPAAAAGEQQGRILGMLRGELEKAQRAGDELGQVQAAGKLAKAEELAEADEPLTHHSATIQQAGKAALEQWVKKQQQQRGQEQQAQPKAELSPDAAAALERIQKGRNRERGRDRGGNEL